MTIDSRLKRHALGFWEVTNKPTIEALRDYYADKYYQQGLGSYEICYSDEELSCLDARLHQRYTLVQQHFGRSGGGARLLDVGCGEGFTLAFFRKRGWAVRGLDFSSAGVTSKNPTCVDALVTGNLYDLLESERTSGNTYDVVWLQNVLEHVLDPLHLLTSLRSLVGPTGLAVVTVPNDFSLIQNAALAENHVDRAYWVAPPEHLSYFDTQSLLKAVNATGWKCTEMLSDFPVDWFLFNAGSNYISNKLLGKSVHKARVQLENVINKQPVDDVIAFWSASAKLGLGRNITAFLTIADER